MISAPSELKGFLFLLPPVGTGGYSHPALSEPSGMKTDNFQIDVITFVRHSSEAQLRSFEDLIIKK
jgi:hypothetical protein